MNLLTPELIPMFPLAAVATGTLLMLFLDLLGVKVSRLVWAALICGAGWLFSLTGFLNFGAPNSSALFHDAFTLVFNTIILGGTFLTALLNDEQLEKQRIKPTIDIDVLLLLAACGGMVMVSAKDLIVLFLGFELLSVAVYVLTGSARGEKASSEGALKYFILGAFSSAFLLYGMVLTYGATGSMEIAQIGKAASLTDPLLLLGLGLMIFGFGFKVSLVPFHFWAPDVYQGAPVTIAAFMAVVVKAAAIGSFVRVMLTAFIGMGSAWQGLIWVLCVLTMSVGNLLALRQKSIKRMLAYSSIAHAGYAMMGLLCIGSSAGGGATVFYMLVYSLMTIAAFGVVLLVTSGSNAQYGEDELSSLRGLGWSHPFLGVVMTISMLSLAGMPPLAGFVGKFYLFNAVIQQGFTGLAIIAAINSVISLYYYLGVLVVMYFSPDRKLDPQNGFSPSSDYALGPRIALTLATVGTIYFGLFSGPLFRMAELAIRAVG